MEKEPSYVVALIMKDGLCVAASRRWKPGNLGLPGGSIEPTDESTFAALAREVMEETGVTVLSAHHVFSRVDETDGNVAWAYIVTEWEGEPRSCEPGIDVSWEEPERLLWACCSFAEYNAKLFKALGFLTPQSEVRRLRLEAENYKRECEAVCEAAEDYAFTSLPYLRGKPGDEHPTKVKLSKLHSLIDRARHVHIFINSMMRAVRLEK